MKRKRIIRNGFDETKVDVSGLTRKQAAAKRRFALWRHNLGKECENVFAFETNRHERNAFKVRQFEARFRGCKI